MFGWDDAAIIAAMTAASAGASYASSAVGTSQSTHVARKVAQYNLKNAKAQMQLQDQLQRAYSKDMTKWGLLTNPAYKMAGLKAAGLNPILAYDSGNSALAAASYSGTGGAQLGNQSVDFAGALRDGFNSALDKKRASNETELKEANVDNINANTTKAKTEADLTATRVSSEETRQDVDSAQVEKLREETRGVKLSNDLKAATNARDVARAKSEYDADQGLLDRIETGYGFGGNVQKHVKTPYERKIENLLQNDTYLNSRERSMLLDAARAIEGGVSAYGTIKGARNGGLFAGAARKGAAASTKNAETNRRNVQLKERAEQRMLRRRKHK